MVGSAVMALARPMVVQRGAFSKMSRIAVASHGAWAAWPAVLFLLVLVGAAFLAMAVFAFSQGNSFDLVTIFGDPLIWRAVRFTLLQALLSTALSAFLALLVIFAWYSLRPFAGSRLLLALFALPLAIPQLVVVLGVLGVFGRNGWIADFLGQWDLAWSGIYGLPGILLAHVFFNAPLLVRVGLSALGGMAHEYELIAAQLGLKGIAKVRLVYWPVLQTGFLSGSALVFLLCMASFTIVLTLGGGPRATTLEVAIYQALTFDFDVSRALILSCLQLVLAGGFVFWITRLARDVTVGMSLYEKADRHVSWFSGSTVMPVWVGAAVIGAFSLFVSAPLIVVVLDGFAAGPVALMFEPVVQSAIWTSLKLAFFSALLALLMSFGLAAVSSSAHQQSYLAGQLLPLLGLVIPPILLAAGWFVLLRQFANPFDFAAPLIVAINAAMALPFALRLLAPAYRSSRQRHDRLCAHLGLEGARRLWLVELRYLRAPLAAGFAFSMALSLGDLGVVALFGSQDVQTLPYVLFQRLGSYRTDDAAGLAFILLAMVLILLLIVEQLGVRGKAHG